MLSWFLSHINMKQPQVLGRMSSPSESSLLPPTPSHPSRPSQSALCHTVNFHRLSNCTYGKAYASMLLPQFVPPSPSPSVHKSVLSSCVFAASLQIGSSVPSLSISYTCANLQHVFFWLTSFWTIGSSVPSLSISYTCANLQHCVFLTYFSLDNRL